MSKIIEFIYIKLTSINHSYQRSVLKLIQEWRYGCEAFAFRNVFASGFDAGLRAKGSLEPRAEHFFALRAVLDANFHCVVAGCDGRAAVGIVQVDHECHGESNNDDCGQFVCHF